MKLNPTAIVRLAGLALLLAFAAPACDSPAGPKYPEPLEEEDPNKDENEG